MSSTSNYKSTDRNENEVIGETLLGDMHFDYFENFTLCLVVV